MKESVADMNPSSIQEKQTPYNVSSPLSTVNIKDDKACLLTMFRLLAASHKSDSLLEGIQTLLELGVKRFGADYALLSKSISSQVFEVNAAYGCGDFFVGQHVTVAEELCGNVIESSSIVVEENLSTFNLSAEAYNQHEFKAYAGAHVSFASGDSGVVSFFWRTPTQRAFSEGDRLIIQLMAEGIACMASLQNVRNRKVRGDQAVFASGSVQSLEEYQSMAELPEGHGISGKVVEALRARVGEAPLNIDAIAEELRLSKRTLQRRLQQQEISFAELRDQVRFHFAIDLLVKQHLSVDKISTILDFSDRTSFTNAFKRWTGLSPSTFRKVFRDYA
ncbi:MAG: AraC-like DNA-binding protein [Flavobacteriales bacterium]